MTLHFLICDDHALMRQALESTIRAHWPQSTISVATDFDTAQRMATPNIDLCICDLKMPGADPVSGMTKLVSPNGAKKIIAITGSCDQHTIDAVMALGVNGIFDKSMDSGILEATIRIVLAGGRFFPTSTAPSPQPAPIKLNMADLQLPLTDQQMLVMKRLCEGHSNKEIAKALGIAPSTVKFHVDNILSRLHAKNRAEAVSRFLAFPNLP